MEEEIFSNVVVQGEDDDNSKNKNTATTAMYRSVVAKRGSFWREEI
jgi:hypothetical protein